MLQNIVESRFTKNLRCEAIPRQYLQNDAIVARYNIMNLSHMRAASYAALAQFTINNVCYRGGTGNHLKKYNDAMQAMRNCWAILTYNNRKMGKRAPGR